MKLKSIAVYCGASDDMPQKYKDTAKAVGRLLAENAIRLVYGGGNTGLMKAVSEGCMEAGGHVLGVMTDYLQDREGINDDITELKIEACMHTRKKLIFLEADGFIILPGGLGTLDEVFEILTWKIIGLHTKPCVFLNHDGFWDMIPQLFDHLIGEKAARKNAKDLFCMVDQVSDLMKGLEKSGRLYPPNGQT